MKRSFASVLTGVIVFLSAAAVLAQPAGPYRIYVSEQTGQMCTFSGSASRCADEGRVVNIQVTATTGPITATITNGAWNGPPCPTYDAHGNRTPAQVQPCISVLVNGSVSPTALPPAGTTEPATVTVRDMGHWTTCSSGETHPYPEEETLNFEIVSLNLSLSRDTLSLDSGETAVLYATPYPYEASVSWSVSGPGFQLISQNGQSATIRYTGPGQGTGNLLASINLGCAVFTQTAFLAAAAAPKQKCKDGQLYDPAKEECFTCGKKKDGTPIIHVVKINSKGCCCGNLVDDKDAPRIHHIASDKQKGANSFTAQFAKIAKKFNLGLDEDWNKVELTKEYHCSSHPDSYHQFVLAGMQKAEKEAKGNAKKFIELFHKYVKEPLLKNPSMLCHKK